MQKWLEHKVTGLWTTRNAVTVGLYPLSLGFRALAAVRRIAYQRYFGGQKLPIPVIIVGNISVGGTGKTPLVIWLANALKRQGFFPGIVTRGYKSGLRASECFFIDEKCTAKEAGDEAIVLAKNARCPVVVGKKRRYAALELIKKYPEINVIISDDGLQHYALPRDIEIAVVDGVRKFGNGFCLPAGPLRESTKRLSKVDFVVVNGKTSMPEWSMDITLSKTVYQVAHPENEQPLSAFSGLKVHAVAAIGAPYRFLNSLAQLNIDYIPHIYPDHYTYRQHDLAFSDPYPILMTEKDAVKCQTIAPRNAWFVRPSVSLSDEFLTEIIGRITNGQKTS